MLYFSYNRQKQQIGKPHSSYKISKIKIVITKIDYIYTIY